jgi:hypothetical protein
MPRAIAVGLAVALVAAGVALDHLRPVGQAELFLALLGASLAGVGVALVWLWPRRLGIGGRVALVLALIAAWRVAYFPIMVFSGHVASIGEWLLVASRGLPIVVYPTFLLSVAVLHGVGAHAAAWLLAPPHRALVALLIPAFAVAALVSFSTAQDLRWLPDRSLSIERAVPPPRDPQTNPYLPRLTEPGYTVPQRVLLSAAGITYSLIPDAPWARTVKGVLEAEFRANPRAPTWSRVQEHYLAYRSAHGMIGCRSQDDCPGARPEREATAATRTPPPSDAPLPDARP